MKPLLGSMAVATLVLGWSCGRSSSTTPKASPSAAAAVASLAPASPTIAVAPTPIPSPAAAATPSPEASNGPRFTGEALRCLDQPSPAIARSWQVSAPRGVPAPVRPGEVVQVGLRNKYGTADEQYYVSARVVMPDGSSTSAATYITGDAWAYLLYPGDFVGAAPVVAGTYTVVWETEAGFLACDGFVVQNY